MGPACATGEWEKTPSTHRIVWPLNPQGNRPREGSTQGRTRGGEQRQNQALVRLAIAQARSEGVRLSGSNGGLGGWWGLSRRKRATIRPRKPGAALTGPSISEASCITGVWCVPRSAHRIAGHADPACVPATCPLLGSAPLKEATPEPSTYCGRRIRSAS